MRWPMPWLHFRASTADRVIRLHDGSKEVGDCTSVLRKAREVEKSLISLSKNLLK